MSAKKRTMKLGFLTSSVLAGNGIASLVGYSAYSDKCAVTEQAIKYLKAEEAALTFDHANRHFRTYEDVQDGFPADQTPEERKLGIEAGYKVESMEAKEHALADRLKNQTFIENGFTGGAAFSASALIALPIRRAKNQRDEPEL